MLTPTNASEQTQYYDPLATQFMTGGQMGYMPNAQFLTDSQYGAFRTLPTAGAVTPVQQQPTLWQNYLNAHRGFNYSIDTYNPTVDQMRHLTMSRRRVADATYGFGGSFTDLATGSLVGGGVAAGLTALGATGVGLPLSIAASMLTPSVASPVLDRIRRGRSVQNLSMPKVISGPDMSMALGQGFSARAATSLDESLRESASQDLIF